MQRADHMKCYCTVEQIQSTGQKKWWNSDHLRGTWMCLYYIPNGGRQQFSTKFVWVDSMFPVMRKTYPEQIKIVNKSRAVHPAGRLKPVVEAEDPYNGR